MPGTDMQTADLPRGVSLSALRQLADDAETIIAAIELKMREALARALHDVAAVVLPIQAKMMSAPLPAISNAERVREKLSGKMHALVSDRLADSYSFTSRLGLPIPSREDAAYAVQTGNYLDSFMRETEASGQDAGRQNDPQPMVGGIQSRNTEATNIGSSASGNKGALPQVSDVRVDDTGRQPTATVGEKGQGEVGFAPDLRCGAFHLMPEDQFRPMHPSAMFPFTHCYTTSVQTTPHLHLMYPHTYGGWHIQCGFVISNDSNDVPPTGWVKWCGKQTFKAEDPPSGPVYVPPGWYPVFFTDGTYWFTDQPGLEQYGDCWERCGGETSIPPAPPKPVPQPAPAPACIPICQPVCPPPAPCPEPAPPPPKPKPPKDPCEKNKEGYVDWESEDECRRINAGQGPKPEGPQEKGGLLGGIGDILLKPGDSFLTTGVGGIISGVAGFNTRSFSGFIADAVKGFLDGWKCIIEAHKCNPPDVLEHGLMAWATGFLNRIAGGALDWLAIPDKYRLNHSCPYNLPQQDDLNTLWLANEVSQDQWVCWTKALGNLVLPQKKLLAAERTRPTVQEYTALFLRKYLKQDEWEKKLRERGVTTDTDRQAFRDLANVWPPLADVIRMMVRDAADEEAAKKYGYDEDFEKKWAGDLVEFGEALGVEKKTAKYYWRAHWQIPSYTQLTEMQYRLRPGRAKPGTEVTELDVTQALKMDDMLPFWVPRMMAMSAHPVNPSDAVKAFMIYAFDEGELRDILMDNKYSEKSADDYIKYLKKERHVRTMRQSGYPTPRQLVRLYSNCLLTNGQLRDVISKIAHSEEQTNAISDAAQLSFEIRQRERAIKTVHRPFILGLIDEGEAAEELARRGVESECVSGLIELWKSEALRRDKHLSAATLCKMRERFIIGPEQQLIALVRQGWSRASAMSITQLCTADIAERNLRRAEAEARKAETRLEKQRKAEERARRLAECGPPKCPKNTPGGSRPSGGQQTSTVDPSDNKDSTTRQS